MSEKSIDAYRVVSVLGYCLLPMVAVGALSVVVKLEPGVHRWPPGRVVVGEKSVHVFSTCSLWKHVVAGPTTLIRELGRNGPQ